MMIPHDECAQVDSLWEATMRRMSIWVLPVVLAIYAGSYTAFRQSNQEVWPKDSRTYVIFPAGAAGHALYYIWRPLSYTDSALTGMRFHVGPHQTS